MLFIAQREIEILREPIGFEKALLEASTAFENPTFGELIVSVDAGQHPAEDIILLDNMRVERCLRRELEDFAPADQSASPSPDDGGTKSRHLETSRVQSKAGSSLALPAVSRARQSWASAAPSLRCSASKPRRLNMAPLPS